MRALALVAALSAWSALAQDGLGAAPSMVACWADGQGAPSMRDASRVSGMRQYTTAETPAASET